jgi:DNA polymerase-1
VSRLLIIDGHAYAYRAFHAIRELRSPSGQATNAVYGFVKMLEKMRSVVGAGHLIVVWDGGLSAERVAALPEYKAQRPEMPEDLRLQLDEIGKYLAAAGIAGYCQDGVEADDYIACLARQAAAGGWQVVIASADKDFMQLVSDRIGLLNPNDKTGKIWAEAEVSAKTGVLPGQVAEWLALMGDAVDNIPGVPGVGTKTAASLLQQFGSIKTLFERLAELKSDRLRQALQGAMALVRRNLELVQLREVDCEFAPAKLAVQAADRDKLRMLYRGWGFNGLLAELDSCEPGRQSELILK